MPIKVNRTTRLDWDALRAKVKGGMRNATLMAIAPTASIGLVAGTTPGLRPAVLADLQPLDLERQVPRGEPQPGRPTCRSSASGTRRSETILRSQGDIQNIDAIPDDVKAIYKTSFQLSPYAFLEVAARAQKWIDQAISRNMYLETRDLGDMMDIYYAAWERGVKTTYYLHMKPRHTGRAVDRQGEQVRGDRRRARSGCASAAAATRPRPRAAPAPRRGFGFGGLATKA